MFGLGKQRRIQRLSENIAACLHNALAFPRRMNNGQVPESLRNDNYVLGYHFGLCLSLYIESVNGWTEPEEQGFVLMNALAIALDNDAHTVGQKLEPLMASPDSEFTRGFDHANSAYARVATGDVTAFMEFNENIRACYQVP
jgi:hypothetical protein